MGLDMWVLEKTEPQVPLQNIRIYDSADVTTEITTNSSVAPNGRIVTQIEFANVGSARADNVTYSAQLPPGLSNIGCTGATCNYDAATGLVSITGLPDALSAGQWLPSIMIRRGPRRQCRHRTASPVHRVQRCGAGLAAEHNL